RTSGDIGHTIKSRTCQINPVQHIKHVREPLFPDKLQEQALVLGNPDFVGCERTDARHQYPGFFRTQVARRHFYIDRKITLLLLLKYIGFTPDLISKQIANRPRFYSIVRWRKGGRYFIPIDAVAFIFNSRTLFLNQTQNLIHAQLLNHKFKTGLVAVIPFAEAVEYTDGTFCEGDNLIFVKKFMGHMSNHGLRSESAPDHYLKTPLFHAIRYAHFGNKAQIVYKSESRITLTGRKGNFKFTSQLLAYRVANQVFKHLLRIGRHVEGFVFINTRCRRCRYVTYRISASLTKGNIVFRQFCPQLGCATSAYEVYLYILPRGEM